MPLLVRARALGNFFRSVKSATASRSQVLGDILAVGAESSPARVSARFWFLNTVTSLRRRRTVYAKSF